MRRIPRRQDRQLVWFELSMALVAALFLAAIIGGKERNVEVVSFPASGSDLAVEIAPASEVRPSTPIAAVDR